MENNMARKTKKEEELRNPEYINRLTDDQIVEYAMREIGKQLPIPELPLIVRRKSMEDKPKKVGAYYATISDVIREGQYAYLDVDVSWEQYKNVRWLAGGGYHVKLKISDFDCVNLSPSRCADHPNETWVDYVNSVLRDREYMKKAKDYMESTYPGFFEEKKKGIRNREIYNIDTNGKSTMHL